MRVIAGTYKGQRLVAPRRGSTRPTADRVREALFSMLGSVQGDRVLDLYAGSGALAIEALSRGASETTLVDSDVAAARAIRQNLDRLGIEQARVVRAGVAPFLKNAAQRRERWDLVFCDPPYRLARRLQGDLERLLPAVVAPKGRIVCESSARQPLHLGFPLVTERHYGDTLVCIYRCSTTAQDA
jgi:16S rRNA (guanine966-N2)-methyltransferase